MVTATVNQPSRIRRFLVWLNESLDDSRVFRRRVDDDGGGRSSGNGINVPASAIVGLVMYLIGSAVTGIWWAATMQAKLDNLTSLNGQLWQKNEALQLQINHDENGLDERIRDKAREVLTDWGYLHIPRKNQD